MRPRRNAASARKERTFLALTLAFLCAACRPVRAEPPVAIGAVSALEQVFPESRPRLDAVARVEAARGEWEPFQIVVRAGSAPLAGVRAEAAPLTGPSGATL